MVSLVSFEDRSFGAFLRRLRLAAGLTQEELATRSGLSPAAISALERGIRRSPYPYTIEQLAAGLALSPDECALFKAAASRGRRQKTRQTHAAPADTPAPETRAVRQAQPKGTVLPPLVGRTREWAWLEHELEDWSPEHWSPEDWSSLVLLTGEPGIGKSRLLHETMAWATEQDWCVLWGGCHRGSGQEPYAPLVEALERHAHALAPDRLRASLEGCAWLTRLLPELADTLHDLAAPPAWPSEQEQRLMFAAVERYLSNIADRAGTLLVLDDLQWAGVDALHLLTRLVRSSGSSTRRLRILGAYRSTDVLPGHPLSILVADLAREELVSQLKLGPLKRRDAAALASAVLEEEGVLRASHGEDGVQGGALAARVVKRAGGVPFFVVSYARWLRTPMPPRGQGQQEPREERDGDARADTAAADARRADPARSDPARSDPARSKEVPWSVAQSIRERVAALPASTQELLNVAAVVGQRASGAVLAAGAGQSETEALAGLEVACQVGLLVAEPGEGGPEHYRFAHDLIRDVVEVGLGAWRQTLFHRRVAIALEHGLQHGDVAERGEDRSLAQLAYHYVRAEVPEKAALYLRQAGDRARQVYAHREAAGYYHELAACLDRAGPSREAALARRDLAVELARVGSFSEVVAPLEQAEQICREVGDVETLALVTMARGQLHTAQGTSEEGLARVHPLLGALAGDQVGEQVGEQVGAQARTGRAPSPPVAVALTAQLQGSLSGLFFMAGHYRDALDSAQRAVDLAQATGDRGLLAREQLLLGVAYFTLGRLTEAIEQLKQAIDGAEAAGDLESLAEALRMASWAYQTQGTFAQSHAAQERALAVAERLGDVVGLGHTLFLDALLAFYLGDWGRARSIAENSLAVFRALDFSHLSAYPPLGLGWLCMIEGHRDAGEQYLAEAETHARQSGPTQVLRFVAALRAECALLAGQPAVANAHLLPWFASEPMQERTRLELSVLRAWAAVQLGEEAEAEALVADTVGSARACQIYLVLPDALRVQALWAMRQQSWQEAEGMLNEAIALCRVMSYPYAEAKALYVCGQLQAAKGALEQASARFEQALAICRRLGERLYSEVIERSLAAIQAQVQAQVQAPVDVPVDAPHHGHGQGRHIDERE